MGLRGDPFYKVEVVVCYVMGRASCCVFRSAFGCLQHPKAGRNFFFSHFSTFLFISELFHVSTNFRKLVEIHNSELSECNRLRIYGATSGIRSTEIEKSLLSDHMFYLHATTTGLSYLSCSPLNLSHSNFAIDICR